MARVRQHGTRAKYVNERCRCEDCRAANNRAQRAYQQRKAQERWGRPTSLVDADPVRRHVRELMGAGLGWKRIGTLTGVGGTTIGVLLWGQPANGRPPLKKVRRETADKLLELTVERVAELVPDGQRIDATGTRRRLQALVAIGWSGSELMRRLGREPTNFGYLTSRNAVRAGTARAVRELYEELWDRQPPDETRGQRCAVTKARQFAAQRGWLPPLAWDEDGIDSAELPAQADLEGDDVDPVVVERCLAGRRVKGMSRAERLAVAREVLAKGGGAGRVAELLRCSGATAEQLLATA